MKPYIMTSAALIVASCAPNLANSDAMSQQAMTVSLQKAALSNLVAGYVPIDRGNVCTGTLTGVIRIHVSEILKKLANSKTIGNRGDIKKIDATAPADEADVTEGYEVKRPTSVPGFPTVFDIETVAVDGNGQDVVLVDATRFVIVRVVLDKRTGKNDNVRFLYPDQDDKNPEFAILRTAGTHEKMFCNLADIDYRPAKNGRPRAFIDFGIQSIHQTTGQPVYGGFGIGLLVIDRNGDQTPIFIDPNVKNNG